ncbi:MAG: biopolymer transporter ExbD, partial [Bryobacterales bacterium]|nr:biopolymer transporter ExbD [Bryobacterales bacterium]
VKTRNPITMEGADKEDAVVVAVTRDGKIFLGSDPVVLDALPSKVKDLLLTRTDKMVYVKADARARYEKVTEAIDSLRGAGVDQVGLLTEKIKDPRAAAAAGI